MKLLENAVAFGFFFQKVNPAHMSMVIYEGNEPSSSSNIWHTSRSPNVIVNETKGFGYMIRVIWMMFVSLFSKYTMLTIERRNIFIEK